MPFLDIELNALVFLERLEPVTLDRGKVHKNISATPVLSNKTKALFRVKPLHSAGCHNHSPDISLDNPLGHR